MPPGASQNDQRNDALRKGRPAVLVVDDNRANLVAMEALLQSLDLDIALAGSGEDALRELLRQDFAVVLMDVQMPGLDGFKTTELIRQRDRTRHTPIIFVTAIFTDDDSAKKAYALGALDFITKPFDEQIIKAKIAALVEHHRQLDVIERQAEALREKQREADRANAAREAAEAANRAKDDFLAMLSHELRAPLNSIVGCASLLERDSTLQPTSLKAAQTLARAARTQSRLIDDLLDASAIVANKLTIDTRVVDLRTVTQSAIASMLPAASQKQIRLDLSVGPESFLTLGDPQRLEQLISHLLSNAIKFSSPDSLVTIELVRRERDLCLRVKDAGVGVSPEFLPHLFERFRQADGSRTRRQNGLGIGLTLARALAHLHGGTLEAFSAGIGAGAVFTLTLPAAGVDKVATEATTLPAEEPATSNLEHARLDGDAQPILGLRILVVDDDGDVREVLSEVLHLAGASVVTAGSASEGLAAFEAGAFDVLISDLGMPGEDGLSLLERIRAVDASRGGRLIAVAVSGYGSSDDRAASRRAGFHAHIVKPADPLDLVALLARLTTSV
jgi:signal transduction histidine kinase